MSAISSRETASRECSDTERADVPLSATNKGAARTMRKQVSAKKDSLARTNLPRTVEQPHRAAAANASSAALRSIAPPGADSPKLTTYAPHNASRRQIQKRLPSGSSSSSQ